MWPTVDGPRILSGDEAALVRGSVGMMLDQLVAEGRQEADQDLFGIDWFDQWDWRQRIWLLDEVTTLLLTPRPAPDAAAMLEATIDAVFCEIYGLVSMELGDLEQIDRNTSWRKSVIDAFRSQRGRQPDLVHDEVDLDQWLIVITQLADGILGPRHYQRAESYRDSDISVTSRFLESKGLPPDFLERIPPLCNLDETQLAIDRIQTLIFDPS